MVNLIRLDIYRNLITIYVHEYVTGFFVKFCTI